MKFLILFSVFLSSCTIRPTVVATNVDGSRVKFTLGGTFAAEADEVVAELEAPGPYHLRYIAKREDSTRVPIAGFQAWLARAVAGFSAHSADLKTTTDGAVALKGVKDPNVIPLDPNVIPKNPNVIPFDPN